MFRNNLKLILRKLKREKLYTFVNILGLTVGLTAFLLIGLYVRDELSFDRFHDNHENIYRVISQSEEGGYSSLVVSDYVDYFEEDSPQIESYTRLAIKEFYSLVESEDKALNVEKVLYTDRNFFEFFSFALDEENLSSVFNQSGSAVITTELSEKLFGSDDPIGKSLKINKDESVIITGLAETVPSNSHIQFEMVVYDQGYFKNDYTNKHFVKSAITYLTLSPGSSAGQVAEEIDAAKPKPDYARFLENESFSLLPMTDQRLKAPFEFDYYENNDIRYVKLFSGIGLVVLLLAVINYINLVTAQSLKRQKEVGLRKVIGAQKLHLVFYHLFESTVVALISFALAFAIAERLMPLYNGWLEKDIILQYDSWEFVSWVFIAGIALGFVSGAYPAFYISRFKPLMLINNKSLGLSNKEGLRKFLVLFQFIISGLLLVVAVLMHNQMRYLKTKDLGFNPEFVVQVPLYRSSEYSHESLKNEIQNISGVEFASVSGWQVGGGAKTGITDDPKNIQESREAAVISADKDYAKTLGLSFIMKADHFEFDKLNSNEVVVNEALVQDFGWENPLGQKIYNFDTRPLEVVAVVADFHTYSLKQEVEPHFIQPLTERSARNALLKINGEQAQQTLANVGEVYESMVQRPFEFYYLNDQIRDFYKKEQGQFLLFQIFSSLAIFVSLLGLVGLTIYTVQQRRKEVSVRKVLGASVQRLILMLNKEYSILVLIAFIIASPIAYYAMQGWLEEFKYRITISPLIFVIACLAFLSLSWLVTIAQSLRVSRENPADVLREE